MWRLSCQTSKVRRASKRGVSERRLRGAKELARKLPGPCWRTMLTWREGTNKRLRSRFARVRVRTAPMWGGRARRRNAAEWDEAGEAQPTKYWLATVGIRRCPFRAFVDSEKCAGELSATTRSSSKKSGSGTTRGADGRASIIMAPSALQLTDTSSPEREISPQNLVSPEAAKKLPFPMVIDHAAPPIRPQRHVPNSIATLHQRLIVAIKGASKMSMLCTPIQKEHASCFLTQYN